MIYPSKELQLYIIKAARYIHDRKYGKIVSEEGYKGIPVQKYIRLTDREIEERKKDLEKYVVY